MPVVYHLKLSKKRIRGAKIALLPGDPGRVPFIASEMHDEKASEIAWNREFRTWVSGSGEQAVVITSTGIGGPSASIVIEELATLGVEVFIRAGTSGAIQYGIRAGDVIITTASVRLDGASEHYAPISYPAVSDYRVLNALVESASNLGIRFHTGITASCATFYAGQERLDTFSNYVIRNLSGSKEEWRKLRVLNYEMESATLLTMCQAMGLQAGCVTGIISERTKHEKIVEKFAAQAERNTIRVALGAVRRLIS